MTFVRLYKRCISYLEALVDQLVDQQVDIKTCSEVNSKLLNLKCRLFDLPTVACELSFRLM